MKLRRAIIMVSAVALTCGFYATDYAGADQSALSALEIARRSDKARRSDSEHQIMTMTLENHRGQQRIRTLEGWSREMGNDEQQRFSRFLEPADIRDTTLLTYDYPHQDDDTWLYLPALKKVKRILSSNKKDSFMGSDFSYEDMENLDLINQDYRLVGTETIAGQDCWIIESTPNNEEEIRDSAYSKTVSWIAKKDFLTHKVEFHDKKNRLAKRLLLEDIHPTSDNDPRPRAHRMLMYNLITKHKTVLDLSTLELDVEVNDEMFSQRNLRR
ncbi:MAG: outer membrane lipoprotein-sorting protein [Deltaproteobacteria bacterium]